VHDHPVRSRREEQGRDHAGRDWLALVAAERRPVEQAQHGGVLRRPAQRVPGDQRLVVQRLLVEADLAHQGVVGWHVQHSAHVVTRRQLAEDIRLARVPGRKRREQLVFDQNGSAQQNRQRGPKLAPPDPLEQDSRAQARQSAHRQSGGQVEAPRRARGIDEGQVLERCPG